MPDRRSIRIVLTGGGTAGHVVPHLALLPELRSRGWDVSYLGSAGIEKELALRAGIPFHQISVGKLRRYFSWRNFSDLFKVAWGLLQSLAVLLRLRPDVVFSKGGFVSVPVAVAARLLGIPVVAHESDVTPGLANRMIVPFATRILYSFPESAQHLPSKKAVLVGTPVRAELFRGERGRGFDLCGFSQEETKPVVLIMGGSQGATKINNAVSAALPRLLERYRIIHLAGRGKLTGAVTSGYKVFDFVSGELADLLAASEFVVSRSGANSIFELLALKKPMLLIPLEEGSRGDQIVNAKSFHKKGWANTLSERSLSTDNLIGALAKLEMDAAAMTSLQEHAVAAAGANQRIIDVLEKAALRR